MKNIIVLISFLLLMVLISACDQIDISKLSDEDLERISDKAVVCNAPYIRYAAECCLDQNDNNICDRDERELTPDEKEKEEKINKETPSGIKPPVEEPPAEPTKPKEKDYISFSGNFNVEKISDQGVSPKVSDEYVVFFTKNFIIKVYNLKVKETKELNFDIRYFGGYDVYKNKLVYATRGGEIFLYNIDTEQKEKITDVVINDRGTNTVGGFYLNENYILWSEPDNVFLYDIKKKEKTKLPDTILRSTLYDDKVVWIDRRREDDSIENEDSRDIYLYHIKSKKEERITEKPIRDLNWISIYSNKIVYHAKSDNFKAQIFIYDLFTKELEQITFEERYQLTPEIYKNLIVWTEYISEEEGENIYVYDLDTNNKILLNTEKMPIVRNQIYENHVVWDMKGQGVYLVTLN